MTTIAAEVRAEGRGDLAGSLTPAPALTNGNTIRQDEMAVKDEDEWTPRPGDAVLVLGRSGAPRDRGWITEIADGEIEVVVAWDAAKRYQVAVERLIPCVVTPTLRWEPLETPEWIR